MKKTLLLLLAAPVATAADWPQYHGPQFNNRAEVSVAPTWPDAAPPDVWRTELNTGFSSLTVADGRAYTLIRRDVDTVDHEVLVALDAGTGEELWSAALCPARYDGGGDAGVSSNRGGDGPRSTPGVDGDRVYVYSSRMKLHCFEAVDGTERWSVDVMKDHNGRKITWESAASPVIDGDLVFVFGGGPGEALLAFRKQDGRLAWKGQADGLTHSTPTPATIHGVRQIVFFTQEGLVGVEAVTGNVLWRQAYPFKVSRAISPVVAGDRIYVSQGYGVGAGVYRVRRDGEDWSVSEVWRTPNKHQNHWSTPVVHDGHLYGLFGHAQHADAPLACVDLDTGDLVWEQEGFGMGNLILAKDQLVVLTDYGDLVMVEPSPEAYHELARASVLSGKCWSTPALSDGRLYVRSTTEGVCLDVSAR